MRITRSALLALLPLLTLVAGGGPDASTAAPGRESGDVGGTHAVAPAQAAPCDKGIDVAGSIAGVAHVAAQDNGICTNADIDVYENGGDAYVVQAGGTEAAFTISRIATDGTPTLVKQLAWPQANTYTPDVKAFKQGAGRYIALALERAAETDSTCGVAIMDVTDAPNVTVADMVDRVVGADWCDVHNVFVEADGSGDGRYLYLTADLPRDMRVLDIGDLNNISEIGRYTHPDAGGENYVHDVTVIDHGGSIGRRVYVSYWDAGVMVLDAADVTPGVVEAGSPNQPLNPDHSIDPPGFKVHHAYPSGDGTRVFIQDEFLTGPGEEPVQMWDIETPGQPAYVAGVPLGSALMPVVNPAHNLLVDGRLLYVGWYKGGLQAFEFDGAGFVGRPIYHQVQTEAGDEPIEGAWGVRLATIGTDTYVFQSDRRYGLIVDVLLDGDVDGVPDGIDNCPAWPNAGQSLPPWPVAPGDADCDGFTDAEEAFVATDPADACPDDPDDDAWPADLASGLPPPDDGYGKHDGSVNILDIVQLTPPTFNSSPPDPDYLARKDVNGDGAINILDIVRLTPPVFSQLCVP